MLQYCDYIADLIRKTLHNDSRQATGFSKIFRAEHVMSDLDPEGGWLRSTTKTITVTDVNGQKYKVTVEAVED